MNEYDVVVIGGGAAGLSAALVLARARRRVAVVDAGRAAQRPGRPHAGLPVSRRAAARRAAGRRPRRGRRLRRPTSSPAPSPTVTPRPATDRPRLRGHASPTAQSLRARRVLVTTGLRDELPDIPGVRERWGRDLLHCPYCHGYEVRDQPLGVLGGTPGGRRRTPTWSGSGPTTSCSSPTAATLTADEREQLVARAIGVVDGPVARLVVEDDRLTGVELDDGHVVPRTAVFVRPAFVPNDDLLDRPRLRHSTTTAGSSPTRPARTSVPGVWVAGNAANPRAQVITAAGEGSAAAIAINADLVDEDVRHRRHRLPPRAPA